MRTIIECNPSRIIILRSTFLVAALALLPAALSSAAAQDNRPSTPVTVVQGVVEVINDVLRQPFVQSVNVPSAGSPTANFDIPDGKRLVIESIAFQASRPSNETNRMFLQPLVSATQRQLVPLPVQFTAVEGAVSYLISLLPLKLRLDSIPGSDNEVQIRRGTGGDGTLNASIFGYLVDI